MLVYMALSLPKIAGGSGGAVTPQAAPGQRPGGRPPWNNNPPLKNAFIEKQYIRQKRNPPFINLGTFWQVWKCLKLDRI